MEYHALSAEKTLQQLSVTRKGLTSYEAKQQREQYGFNEIETRKKVGILNKFLHQFCDFMIIILIIAAGVSFAVTVWTKEYDYADTVMILLIVILNAVLGVVQEAKAEKSLEALKKLSAPLATVARDGAVSRIPARELVPGDIIEMKAGEYVPADCRLITSTKMKADESVLTGESKSVSKDANVVLPSETVTGDRRNMIFSMSSIVQGSGTAVVTETGLQTQAGHIAQMISCGKMKTTPLQERLSKAGGLLGTGALIICAIIFLTGLIQGRPAFSMFMTSVSLAVAAIPEGLPAIVTIMLSVGVQRMVKKNAVVRKLAAVETLGCATVICSDKTGTLTENELTATEFSIPDSEQTITSYHDRRLIPILESMVLCNHADENNGEPLERCIFKAAEKASVSVKTLRMKNPIVDEVPFDSSRKRMTTVHKTESGKYRMIIKGAYDYLAPMAGFVLEENRIVPITQAHRERLNELHAKMAENALRMIAVCYKDTTYFQNPEEEEYNLVFVGMAGMLDPPRQGVKEAVKQCKSAGMKPVMITGDHVDTACAIAEKIGIIETDGEKYSMNRQAMTGSRMQELSDGELTDIIQDYSVFARVSPEHKVRIVEAFQHHGHVVAMTGDGINDAPALKRADIGCAMGRSGTDVAKGAADMILTDDNFSTIVSAVEEGRNIYDNIKKSVHFLVSCNIGEIITIFAAILFGMPTPLVAIQLLFVNLVTDSLPAIALGAEKPEQDCMKRPPIRKEEGIFADGLAISVVLEGMMIGILSLISYYIGGATMVFAVLGLSQLVHCYNVRSRESVFRIGLFSNRKMNLAFLIGVALVIIVISNHRLAALFCVHPMMLSEWLITGALSLTPLLIVEIHKFISKRKEVD